MIKAMAALLAAAALLASLEGCASPPRPRPASDCGRGASPRAEALTVPDSGHAPESGGSTASCVIALQTDFVRTGRLPAADCLGGIPAVAVERG
ncbi:hypothetical protein IL992_23845 [Microbispora sp. NEAU-D428]|uniref:hypothetical protein n=1 Tax=Microbispora sitophila TaxID=2771537 RepID=UPI001868BFA9|nr:hypothetical protein [Microbispora sitophila]MBE3012206.1 hypothetical protein [Microbispora sitophila]